MFANSLHFVRHVPIAILSSVALLCFAYGAEPETASQRTTAELQKSIVFRASFDKDTSAEIGGGDKQIYTAESLERKESKAGLQTKAVRWERTDGPRAGALHFTTATKELIYFKGLKNLPYREKNFQGSVSFWMKLSPKEDLPKGYVDPLQITDKKWNDSSFFVDFDQTEERPFRLGVFSDYKFWNPTDRKFDDIPMKERPMVPVTKWPFDRKRWTHVAFTWKGFNTDKPASATLFLDGKSQGSLSTKQQFSWSPDKTVIMLGINYVGWLDDLVIFDRALAEPEVKILLADGALAPVGNR